MAKGSANVRFDGIPEVVAALRANDQLIEQATNQAFYAAVTQIGKRANRLVPVDTGNLRSSQKIEWSPRVLGASISYGGTAAPYAIVQHERLDFFHPPKPPNKSKVGRRSGTGTVEPGTGRGPKYLETAFLEEVSRWPEKLTARIRAHYRALTSGGK
jgi:hypothetical protein